MTRISFTDDELVALLDRVSAGWESQDEGLEESVFWTRLRLLDKIEAACRRRGLKEYRRATRLRPVWLARDSADG